MPRSQTLFSFSLFQTLLFSTSNEEVSLKRSLWFKILLIQKISNFECSQRLSIQLNNLWIRQQIESILSTRWVHPPPSASTISHQRWSASCLSTYTWKIWLPARWSTGAGTRSTPPSSCTRWSQLTLVLNSIMVPSNFTIQTGELKRQTGAVRPCSFVWQRSRCFPTSSDWFCVTYAYLNSISTSWTSSDTWCTSTSEWI